MITTFVVLPSCDALYQTEGRIVLLRVRVSNWPQSLSLPGDKRPDRIEKVQSCHCRHIGLGLHVCSLRPKPKCESSTRSIWYNLGIQICLHRGSERSTNIIGRPNWPTKVNFHRQRRGNVPRLAQHKLALKFAMAACFEPLAGLAAVVLKMNCPTQECLQSL